MFCKLFIQCTVYLQYWSQSFKRWIAQLVPLILIHWIVIFPVDSAIHLLNNWGQDKKSWDTVMKFKFKFKFKFNNSFYQCTK